MLGAALTLLCSAAPVTQAWSVSAGDWSGRTPVLAAAGETVLFDTYQDLRQVRASDGKLVRKLDKRSCVGAVIDLRVEGGLALVLCEAPRGEGGQDSRIFSTLVAIDLKTGKQRWSHDGVIPPPIQVDGTHVVFADDEQLSALELSTGKPVWSSPATATTDGIAIGTGTCALAAGELLLAFAPADGKPRWKAALNGGAREAPVIAGESVFAVNDPGARDERAGYTLSAHASSDGTQRWARAFKHEFLFTQPVVWHELLLVVALGEESGGHLYGVSQATGKPVWSVPWESDANGHDFRPTPYGELMLAWTGVPGKQGDYQLSAFDPASGAVKWSFAPSTDEKFSFSRPLIIGGKIVYADGNTVRGLSAPRTAH